ncbi:macrophage colony-stimulating factor 1 isoform X2 [Microtus pennsylvanicus]|uniref:macrophage colony-stimulating factor 1 isoform X2 n=1 Tax=Microtus pennsylvanicus TaxID=10058 RepID=UPI003F6D7B89
MTAWGAAGRCPSSTWLGPRLLLVCLLVGRSIAKEVSEHCSHMIGNGHLQVLQQLIDSQMETSCQITFDFVDQEQFENDTVCYLKKAFFLVEDIIEENMRFKDNTPNANATERLQELSLRLRNCFTTDYGEDNKSCVRTFHETPLQLLEKIKDVFNKTKNLLETDWNIFSKNCKNSFDKCSSPEDSIQAEMDRSRDLSASSPLHKSTEDQQPAETDTPLPEVNATRPTGQTQNHTPEKTDGSSMLPGDHQEPGSPPISTLGPQGLRNPATPFAQSLLPRSHSWGIVLPLRELEGKRSTRDRRSPTELEGGPASEGAARPVAHFNSIPLTDTGIEMKQKNDLNPNKFVFHLLVPGIILVLLTVGGLLFYRWKRRIHQEPLTLNSYVGRPEGSPLTQDEDRRVELPV